MRILLLILLAGSLAILGCQRKTPQVQTLVQQPAPTESSQRTELIPIVEEAVVVGPGKEESYSPIRYVPYPTRDQRNLTQIGPLPTATNGCDFVGEVWDFAGLDNCGTLLETTAGHIFQVSSLPQGYFLEAGSRIRFGFRYDETAPASACPHQDAIIRITCLQSLRPGSGFTRPFVCESFDKPSQWIHELILDLGATYVTRFPWDDDRLVYLFESPGGQYLYDCRGFLLCQPKQNCLKFIDDFSLGVQIYGDE